MSTPTASRLHSEFPPDNGRRDSADQDRHNEETGQRPDRNGILRRPAAALPTHKLEQQFRRDM
jgi:hypothetical protein